MSRGFETFAAILMLRGRQQSGYFLLDDSERKCLHRGMLGYSLVCRTCNF